MLRGNRTGCIQQLDSQKTTQSQMADVRSIMHCRVCLCETRGHRECQSSKYSCSGWSNEQSPQWTEEFHDTGNVGSASTGYVYQWSLQCESSDLSNGTTNYRNDDSNRTYQRNAKPTSVIPNTTATTTPTGPTSVIPNTTKTTTTTTKSSSGYTIQSEGTVQARTTISPAPAGANEICRLMWKVKNLQLRLQLLTDKLGKL